MRGPPDNQTLNAEQSVLGALLLDAQGTLPRIGHLAAEQFEDDDHRAIFRAIIGCLDGGVVDLVTVNARLERNGCGGNGMATYLASLAQAVPGTAGAARYAEIVRKAARRRELRALGAEIAERAGASGADPEALRGEILERVQALEGADGVPHALDLAELAKREPRRPQFIIEDWLPTGYATLLAGHGGAGKSAIASHLAVCVALGRTFFGLEVARRRVLYLSCEDRADVLHWRLSRICAHEGIDLAGLHGELIVLDQVGVDCVLWERNPRTGHTVTPVYWRLQNAVRRHRAEVLVIDGIADTFAGNENARGEVKRYINALVALIPATGAVLLIGHIAKLAVTTATMAEGYSGSTSWHNSTRARWYLFPATARGDEDERPERTGRLLLELQKSNLGRAEGSLAFRWDAEAHLFLAEPGQTILDRRHQDQHERDGILAAMRSCSAAGIYVPAASTGKRTAHHVLKAQAAFPDSLREGKLAVRRFWRLIEEMRAMGTVRESSIRRADYHKTATLEATTEGTR